MNRLTIGMATYRDPSGCYFTLEALRIYHGWDFEILVVDNGPERCRRTEKTVKAVGGRYFYRPDLTGTSRSREAVFHFAETEWVMCCDSHVLFHPGSIAKLQEMIEGPEHAKDLLTGPLVGDDLKWHATHWEPHEPPGLWGQWETHDCGRWIGAFGDRMYPFDVAMQGLGCFAMAKSSWVGFHPLSRGFGGEEGYIHEKARRAGGRVLCIPQLKWTHYFRDGETNRSPYPVMLADHVFNLLVQHRELALDAEDLIFETYGKDLTDVEWQGVLAESREKQPYGQRLPPVPISTWQHDHQAYRPIVRKVEKPRPDRTIKFQPPKSVPIVRQVTITSEMQNVPPPPHCRFRRGVTLRPKGAAKDSIWVECANPKTPLQMVVKQKGLIDTTGKAVCGCVGCGPDCNGYELPVGDKP